MVKNMVLVVRPNRDSPENGGLEGPMAYGEVWMQSVLNSLLLRGPKSELHGDKAIGSEFENAVKTLDCSLSVGVGHGAPDLWVGQYIEGSYSPLLTPANVDLMAGRVVYLLSCLVAQELGPMMVDNGAIAFAGYNQEFVWTTADPSHPATDRLAAPFARASTAYPKELVKGKTVKEAKDKAIEVFNEEMDAWEKSDDPYAREVVKWLNFDMLAFTVLGDEEAVGFEPKLAVGLIAVGVGAAAATIGYLIYRRRKKGK